MRRYDFILFDADNTLFDYDRAERSALEAALAELGVDSGSDTHDTYRRVNGTYWDLFELGKVTAEELRVGRFAEFAKEAGFDADPERLSDRYLAFLGSAGFLVKGAVDVVRRLAEDGYTLAMITNGLARVQKSRLAASPLERFFVSVTISDEVGAKKPDPEIFEIAFRNSGSPPKDRSIIIGDSLSSDMAGGRAFGIATCWYNPKQLPVPLELAKTGKAPDYVIRDLQEIVGVVGGG